MPPISGASNFDTYPVIRFCLLWSYPSWVWRQEFGVIPATTQDWVEEHSQNFMTRTPNENNASPQSLGSLPAADPFVTIFWHENLGPGSPWQFQQRDLPIPLGILVRSSGPCMIGVSGVRGRVGMIVRVGSCEKILKGSWCKPLDVFAWSRTGPCEKILWRFCFNPPREVLASTSWKCSALVLVWKFFWDAQGRSCLKILWDPQDSI